MRYCFQSSELEEIKCMAWERKGEERERERERIEKEGEREERERRDRGERERDYMTLECAISCIHSII